MPGQAFLPESPGKSLEAALPNGWQRVNPLPPSGVFQFGPPGKPASPPEEAPTVRAERGRRAADRSGRRAPGRRTAKYA